MFNFIDNIIGYCFESIIYHTNMIAKRIKHKLSYTYYNIKLNLKKF